MSENKLRLATCAHFTGIQHDKCKAGLSPMSTRMLPAKGMAVFACIRGADWGGDCAPECSGYRAMTAAEVDAEEAEIGRALDLVDRDLSPCCEAPIVQRYSSGPRHCSKCRKVAYWGCGAHDD